MRFKRLLKFPGCHSYLNKGNAGQYHILPIKSHFFGISHAQTPAMATRINLLLLDQVSRSSEHPLLINTEKYSNVQNRLRGSLATNFDTGGQPFT